MESIREILSHYYAGPECSICSLHPNGEQRESLSSIKKNGICYACHIMKKEDERFPELDPDHAHAYWFSKCAGCDVKFHLRDLVIFSAHRWCINCIHTAPGMDIVKLVAMDRMKAK